MNYREKRLAELVDNYNHHADTATTLRAKARDSERTADTYAAAIDSMSPTEAEADSLGWIRA